jgi:hypothetical protein
MLKLNVVVICEALLAEPADWIPVDQNFLAPGEFRGRAEFSMAARVMRIVNAADWPTRFLELSRFRRCMAGARCAAMERAALSGF